jgi:hypothetical protein
MYDKYDNQWFDVTGALPKEEATKIWNEKTSNGRIRTHYADGTYYKIFPANTKMMYSDGYGEI